jgi:hypothetical protein
MLAIAAMAMYFIDISEIYIFQKRIVLSPRFAEKEKM